MSLSAQLEQLSGELAQIFPPSVTETLSSGLAQFLSEFSAKDTIQIGDTFPSFTLLAQDDSPVHSSDLLKRGPILLTFFRGNWCPFCNLTLKELQAIVPQLKAANPNVQVVAVSPQLPAFVKPIEGAEGHAEHSLSIYSDKGNDLARTLGLAWHLPISFDTSFRELGMDIHSQNQQKEGHLQVPVPATFYIDQSGIVKRTFIDPDFTKRLEPQQALKWVQDEAK